MSEQIDNTADIIDSREVIERIAELEEEHASRIHDAARSGASYAEMAEVEEEIAQEVSAELAPLRALAAEGEALADWQHGETLVRDSYFEDYARELAEDIGALSPDAGWPNNCIDWERAARDLRMDYTALDFDGVTYWGRS